jgi:hypothetical protein
VNPKVKVLLDARKILKKRGWRRNNVGDTSGGPVCALGAIGLADKGHTYAVDDKDSLTYRIHIDQMHQGCRISSFNDIDAESIDDVLDYLQNIAEKYSLEEV